jgi:DNA-binding response OmpR family regulator
MNEITVMVVDDHEEFRDILSTYLEEEGYNVVQAEDGEAALESVKFRKPNLILLDIMMPRKDGYDVCRELKANPDTAHIPIIFLSAKSTLSDKLTGYISGGQRYLCKPFDMNELEECLRNVLRQQNIKDIQLGSDVMYRGDHDN